MRINQNGMSIIELLIAAGLTAIVALGAASVIYNAQKTSQFGTIQNDIDRIHYLNLQIVRNTKNIDALLAMPGYSQLATCLQYSQYKAGSGSPLAGCTAYAASLGSGIPFNASNGAAGFTSMTLVNNNSTNTAGSIQSTATLLPHCPTVNGCDYLALSLKTSYVPAPSGTSLGNFIARTSNSNLPNFLFVGRNQLSFDVPGPSAACPPNQIVGGIDYATRSYICYSVQVPYDGSSNTAQLPLEVYDSGGSSTYTVGSVNTQACPNGYASATFSGSTCLGNSTLSAPPTPTTTTTSTTLPFTATIRFGGCFIAGTQVMMEDGSTKSIELVQVGDKVLTYDESRDRQVIRPVSEIDHHDKHENDLYTFTLSDGSHVTSNDIHLFFLVDYRQYASAAEIYRHWSHGAELRLLNDKNQPVVIADMKKETKDVKVYNLHVQSEYDLPGEPASHYGHNYYANGVLVHNCKALCPVNVAAAMSNKAAACCSSNGGTYTSGFLGCAVMYNCTLPNANIPAARSCVAAWISGPPLAPPCPNGNYVY